MCIDIYVYIHTYIDRQVFSYIKCLWGNEATELDERGLHPYPKPVEMSKSPTPGWFTIGVGYSWIWLATIGYI